MYRFESFPMKVLRKFAKRRKVRYSRLRKAQLVQRLYEYENAKAIQKWYRRIYDTYVNHKDFATLDTLKGIMLRVNERGKCYRFDPSSLCEALYKTGKLMNPYTRTEFSHRTLLQLQECLRRTGNIGMLNQMNQILQDKKQWELERKHQREIEVTVDQLVQDCYRILDPFWSCGNLESCYSTLLHIMPAFHDKWYMLFQIQNEAAYDCIIRIYARVKQIPNRSIRSMAMHHLHQVWDILIHNLR